MVSRFKVPNIVESLDMFSRDLPSFNLRGQNKVASTTGAIISFVILFILFLYGAVKMTQLASRSNPNITSFVQQNYFDGTNVVNFKERNLRFAFGIEGQLDKALKDDKRYVKWLVRALYKVSES